MLLLLEPVKHGRLNYNCENKYENLGKDLGFYNEKTAKNPAANFVNKL
jgi:hypothetical protein